MSYLDHPNNEVQMSQEKPEPRYSLGVDVTIQPDGTDRTVIAVFDRHAKKFVACGDAVIQNLSAHNVALVAKQLPEIALQSWVSEMGEKANLAIALWPEWKRKGAQHIFRSGQ